MSNPPPSTEDERKTLLGKRFTAALIDAVIGGVILALVSIVHPSLGALACCLYILIKDGLNLPLMTQRSFGKHVLSIQPVPLSGGEMDLKTSAMRNWPLALPTFTAMLPGGLIYAILSAVALLAVLGEIFLAFTQSDGRRIGDQIADTEVR